MTQVQVDKARAQLAPYGYRLAADGCNLLAPDGAATGFWVNRKGPRYQVRLAVDRTLYWSGSDLGRFLEDFWYARKVEAA